MNLPSEGQLSDINKELAELLEIDVSTVGKWETGDRDPSEDMLRRIIELPNESPSESRRMGVTSPSEACRKGVGLASETKKSEADPTIYKEIKNKDAYMRITNHVRTTTDATCIIKDKDSMTKRVRNNAKATKSKKSSKTPSTKTSSKVPTAKKKSIDPTNPCSACPALKEKDKRFVDGEG